jgi:hypothetical protein
VWEGFGQNATLNPRSFANLVPEPSGRSPRRQENNLGANGRTEGQEEAAAESVFFHFSEAPNNRVCRYFYLFQHRRNPPPTHPHTIHPPTHPCENALKTNLWEGRGGIPVLPPPPEKPPPGPYILNPKP